MEICSCTSLSKYVPFRLSRFQSNPNQVYVVERPKACSDSYDILPPKRHADSLEDDANKVCLHDSRSVPIFAETVVLIAEFGRFAICHLAISLIR